MQTRSILIVDDDPTSLKLTRFLLSAEGFEVQTASNAEDAQATAAASHPCLILMDIQLPGMDGLELTRRLKADPATRDVVVLALTAYAVNGYAEAAREAGCDGCIAKPIDTSTFANIVKRHLGIQESADPTAGSGDYHDLLGQLRNDFLVEGADETERVLGNRHEKFDRQRLLRLTHRWAGVGGTLGMPEISRKARQIKQSLENPDSELFVDRDSSGLQSGEFSSRLWADLLAIQEMFSTAITKHCQAPFVSEVVNRALSCKLIGIVGFEPPEAARIAGAFEGTGATSEILPQAPGDERFRYFDVMIVNAQEQSLPRGLSLEKLVHEGKPVLFIAGGGAALLHSPDLLDQLGDFLLEPFDAQEVVLRTCRLLSRKTKPAGLGPVRAGKDSDLRRVQRPLRVLVVDDAPEITALVGGALQELGVEFTCVHDGRAALDLARTLLPDVIVLDVIMPELDGFGVLTSLKRDERTRHIKVIMLTACEEESDLMRGFGLGADDYVRKPFNPREVAARVTRFAADIPALSYR